LLICLAARRLRGLWRRSRNSSTECAGWGSYLGNAEDDQVTWIAALQEELVKLGWTKGRNIEIVIRSRSSRCCVDEAVRKGTCRAPARPHSDAKHARRCGDAGTNAYHPRRLRVGCRSCREGFVASLPRPGGNATGFTPIVSSLGGKWVELLKEIAPHVAGVTLLYNPSTATFVRDYVNSFRAAAASVGVEAIVAPVNDMPELQKWVDRGAASNARQASSAFVWSALLLRFLGQDSNLATVAAGPR
jgi:putative tryptophan/tyrosine transport system substrate-binding protein